MTSWYGRAGQTPDGQGVPQDAGSSSVGPGGAGSQDVPVTAPLGSAPVDGASESGRASESVRGAADAASGALEAEEDTSGRSGKSRLPDGPLSSRAVLGFEGTLSEAIKAEVVPIPDLMDHNEWKTWRAADGLRPSVNSGGARGSRMFTTPAEESQMWRAILDHWTTHGQWGVLNKIWHTYTPIKIVQLVQPLNGKIGNRNC